MAIAKDILTKGLQGQIGKKVVFKKYGKKTVVTQYPDMSNIEPSQLQINKRSKFSEAVLYAQNIIYNPELKAAYSEKIKKGKSVYHYAIKEYLQKNNK